MVEKEIESRNRKKYWELYLMLYSRMTKDTFISFEEFYGEDFSKYSKISDQEIREELLPIIENHEKR